jgi:acetyl esterase/lipase
LFTFLSLEKYSHGSQPRYNVPEIISQVQRAIKFIRYNAGKYGVDPMRFGVMGHSAGGHLSVSSAVFGKDAMTEAEYRKANNIPEKDKVDSINLVSSKVKVVACFYPPTNFVQYISADSNWFDFPTVRNVSANGSFVATPDSSREFQNKILKSISPYYFITPQTPPILVIHGTSDKLVPYSQSVSLIAKLKEQHVPCMLIPKEGKGHGWEDSDKSDEKACLAWFDKYLLK